jgi:hypothetical protein
LKKSVKALNAYALIFHQERFFFLGYIKIFTEVENAIHHIDNTGGMRTTITTTTTVIGQGNEEMAEIANLTRMFEQPKRGKEATNCQFQKVVILPIIIGINIFL